jgi:DNA-binding transcriptional LysR family regulator
MTLEQLRIFVGVAEREHMTRAAEALGVTQSAASAAIALEARHDVPLFNRVGRGIELTEAGRMFLDEARAVLGRAATAELTLAEYGGLKRGTLRLVASQTIASYWLPSRLAQFHSRHPRSASNSQSTTARVRRHRYWMAARNWALSKVRSTSPHSPTGKSARTGCC